MTDGALPTVSVDATMGEAFAAAAAADRVVAVVGTDGRVLGTVTDGDVRRAVAAGTPLDAPVTDILRREPGEALPQSAPPVGVLMVGGRGERLRPLTDKVPKPLLRVGGATIVERLVRSLRLAGVDEVYLTVNYLAEQFEERLGDGQALGVRLHYVREEQAMDTAGSLSLLPDMGRPLLVSNGDLVTTIDFAAMLEFHRQQRAAITVAGVQYAAKVPYGVLRTAGHHLLHIEEKPTTHQLVNAGMYVLSPEVLRYVPGDKPYKMTELIEDVLHDGQNVSVFPVLERWSDIGSKEEFERVLFDFAVEEES
jgi:NDP-sugar pyrophosphorylase family protein